MPKKGNERKILYYLCFPKSSPMLFKWGLDELQQGRAHRTSARQASQTEETSWKKVLLFKCIKIKVYSVGSPP